jgi:hypothetical protein
MGTKNAHISTFPFDCPENESPENVPKKKLLQALLFLFLTNKLT